MFFFFSSWSQDVVSPFRDQLTPVYTRMKLKMHNVLHQRNEKRKKKKSNDQVEHVIPKCRHNQLANWAYIQSQNVHCVLSTLYTQKKKILKNKLNEIEVEMEIIWNPFSSRSVTCLCENKEKTPKVHPLSELWNKLNTIFRQIYRIRTICEAT